jgi:hypothetical protein
VKLAALSLVLVACARAQSACPADAAVQVEPVDLGPRTWAFALDAGAFPRASWPGVVVYAPSGFHVVKPQPVVIWLRGIDNCAANVLRDHNGECTPGGGPREAFQLAGQLEAAGRNVLLIVPELSFDSPSSDPGNLATPGGLRALLRETFADLAPALGPIGVDELGPVIIAAHSAAWRSTSAILMAHDVAATEVWELDAIYEGLPVFADWIESHLNDFTGSPPERRFVDIYTVETAENSVNLAEAAEVNWLPDAGAVIDDRGDGDLPDDELRRGLVFKYSSLSHLDVPRVWFRRLLVTSRLPPRTSP